LSELPFACERLNDHRVLQTWKIELNHWDYRRLADIRLEKEN
jgi:hypothetical protein